MLRSMPQATQGRSRSETQIDILGQDTPNHHGLGPLLLSRPAAGRRAAPTAFATGGIADLLPPLMAVMGQSLAEGTGEVPKVSQLLAARKGGKARNVPASPVPNSLASGPVLRHSRAGVKALRSSESSASRAEIIAFLRQALNGRKGGL